MAILAASKKYNNYCIAGIDLETGDWIRLISDDNSIEHAVRQQDMKYSDGSYASVLDTIKVEIIKHKPNFYQPENYVFDKGYYWIKSGKMSVTEVIRKFGISENKYIFHNDDPYLTPKFLTELADGRKYSLIIVKPKNTYIRITQWEDKPKKARAIFDYNNDTYDLPITDILFSDSITTRSIGTYNYSDRDFVFVISLGAPSPHDDLHYKLIAQVLEI